MEVHESEFELNLSFLDYTSEPPAKYAGQHDSPKAGQWLVPASSH
jgi:hypothetical protein